jgi:hypothetical protein
VLSIAIMPFEFVNNNDTIDPASRRRIRSHVAKGKNVGRKLVRPSRIKAFERKAQGGTALDHIPSRPKVREGDEQNEQEGEEEEAHHLESSQCVVHQIERQVGDGLSDYFSLKQTPESKSLVRRSKFTYLETGMQTSLLCTAEANHIYPAFSFLSGIGLDPQLRNAIGTSGTPDLMWVQLMLVDEACMYDLRILDL